MAPARRLRPDRRARRDAALSRAVVDGKKYEKAKKYEKTRKLANHEEAIRLILKWIEAKFPDIVVGAIGHRVVHGGLNHSAPAIVDRRFSRICGR